jgi:hypothetical protein
MDKKLKAETLALVLLLAAFPITSWGTAASNHLVWWIGFLRLIAGGVLPVWTLHGSFRRRDQGRRHGIRRSHFVVPTRAEALVACGPENRCL